MFAETSRRDLPDTCIARDGEGFEHDLLDDETANEVAGCDAAREGLAETLPMLCAYVVRHVEAKLAAL